MPNQTSQQPKPKTTQNQPSEVAQNLNKAAIYLYQYLKLLASAQR